jgi:diguanylate cyclase (GGDEF)-like protein
MRFGYGPAMAVTVCFVGFDAGERYHVGLGPDGPFLIRSGFLALTALLASYLRELARRADVALQLELRHATHVALHDRLTGLANRTLLTNRLDQAIQDAKLQAGSVAVLFIDLNRFKEVNDTFGHRYGDLVLQETARRLGAAVAASATLARLSADEFAVVLPDADTAVAKRTAERILRLLERSMPLQDVSVELSASIGIAIAPEHGTDADCVQRRAAVALDAARSRRQPYLLYSAALDRDSRDRLALAGDLRRAIQRGELRVHYQPIVSLRSNRIEEVEALVRWQHPTRGLVPPGQFIPLAEETGMIVAIGEWVLEEACRQAASWRARLANSRDLVMSVNLSARQLQHADVPTAVRDILQRTGLEPQALKLEITESVAMSDPELSIAALWLLRGMGVHLAIDDFGTGYSSLGYLKRFPADTLKIDRVFIDGLAINPEDEAIVAATIAFAGAVGISTTAEGVETAEQLAILRHLGVNRVQGYFCSRPVPPEQMEALLDSDWRLGAGPLTALRVA